MRIKCPICGERDLREFSYSGAAVYLDRPAADAPTEDWDAYLHLRDNPAGLTADLWYHGMGCSAWLVVERDTTTHDILSVRLASDVKHEGSV
ncbi:MAG: sarcosine oxidase subunit delta [Pseudomonadota bacterium]